MKMSQNGRLPVFIQSEIAECGLTCLAMIAAYHGREVNLRGIRHHFPISSRGSNLKHLIEIGEQLGLNCRPVRLEIGSLADLKAPCVLHWDLNHFVVLESVKGRKVTLHDPAVGRRCYDIDVVSHHFTGVAVEILPIADFRLPMMKTSLPLKPFFKRMLGLKRSLFQAAILTSILLLFTVIMPMCVQLILDRVLITGDEHLLIVIGLSLMGIMVFKALIELLREILLIRLGGLFIFQFGNNLFYRILRLPLGFFERRHIGDIVSRFQSMYEIKRFLTQGIIAGIIDGLMSVVIVILMLSYSVRLTLIVLGAMAINCAVRIGAFATVRELIESSIMARAKEQSHFMESIRSIQTIKLYCGEQERQTFWQNLFGNVVHIEARTERHRAMFMAGSQLVLDFQKAIVLYVGALSVLEGTLSSGMLVAYIAYHSQFSDRIVALLEKFVEFKMLGLHMERLADLALPDIEPSVMSESEITPIAGHIKGTGLSFRYDQQSPIVFKDLAFEIAAGEHVAIIGTSGCGKSTFLKVLLGLLQPEAGEIEVDGLNLSQRPQSFRKQIATVMQNDQLVSGTISDNIAFLDPAPNLSQIILCARRAAIFDDIMAMPMQFNTLVGDMGSTLSGGQKQRVLLARALYRQPKIIFLDEATSHLDSVGEERINAAIKELPMTRIVVAHRKETILAADRVLELKNGQLFPVQKEVLHRLELV